MKRICLIGDSHLAAVKSGWDQIGGEFDAEATFFASAGSRFNVVAVKDCLCGATREVEGGFRRTSGGKGRIRPADYDSILIVGAGYNPLEVVELYARFRAESQSPGSGHRLISDLCFEEAATGILRASMAMDARNKLRQLSEKPVVIVPQPLPAEGVLASGSGRGHLFQQVIDQGDAPTMAAVLKAAGRALSSPDTIIFDQPAQTIRHGVVTKDEYARTPALLHAWQDAAAGVQPKPSSPADNKHMNAAYGVVVLRELAARGLI